MSLQAKEAVIQFSQSEVTAEQLADAVIKMSFPSFVKKNSFQDAVVFIDGMTCMSCVRNIEGSLSAKSGIKFIRVSLDKKLGYVKFDPKLTSSENIKKIIDNMGFVTSLTPPGEDGQTTILNRANTYIEVVVHISQLLSVANCPLFTSFSSFLWQHNLL